MINIAFAIHAAIMATFVASMGLFIVGRFTRVLGGWRGTYVISWLIIFMDVFLFIYWADGAL